MTDTYVIQFNITENIEVGTKIINLFDIIIPRPYNINTELTLLKNPFFVIEKRDELIVTSPLNRDDNPALCNYQITYKPCIWKSLVLSNSGIIYRIELRILDVNDNAPVWPMSRYVISITEQVPVESFKQDIPAAFDPDEYPNNVLKYDIEPPSKYVYITNANMTDDNDQNIVQPILKLRKVIDRELMSWHNITVVAIDGGRGLASKTGTLKLSMQILDINDNTPMFESSIYRKYVSENTPINTEIDLHIRATDMDQDGANNQITYSFSIEVAHEITNCFKLDPKTAILKVIKLLRGKCYKSNYKFNITASDGGSPVRRSKSTVELILKRQLEEVPVINIFKLKDPVEILENEPGGQEIVTGFVKYSSKSEEVINCDLNGDHADKFIFKINHTKTSKIALLRVITNYSFDREVIDEFTLIICCKSRSNSQLSTSKMINVDIIDQNDNAPLFERDRYEFQILEENEVKEKVGSVMAIDKDSGGNSRVTYRMAGADEENGTKIAVTKSGEIFTIERMDREQYPQGILFHIIAEDEGDPVLSNTCQVHITLLDINDHTPQFSDSLFNFTISEDFGTHFQSRTIGQVTAEDKDVNNNSLLTYSIIHSSPLPFTINPRTGQIYTTSLLDRESNLGPYQFSVQVVDNPANLLFRRTSSTLISINISDLNDNSPEIVHPDPHHNSNEILLSYLSPVNTVVVHVKARDSDTGLNGRVTYSLVDPLRNILFKINPKSGTIKTSTVLTNLHQGREVIYVKISDAGVPRQTTLLKLTIVIGPYPLRPIDQSHESVSQNEGLSDKVVMVIVGVVITTFCVCCVLISGICAVSYKRWKMRSSLPAHSLVISGHQATMSSDCNNNSRLGGSVGSSDENYRLVFHNTRGADPNFKCGVPDASSLLETVLLSTSTPSHIPISNPTSVLPLPNLIHTSDYSPVSLQLPNILLQHTPNNQISSSYTRTNQNSPPSSSISSSNQITSQFGRTNQNSPLPIPNQISHDEILALSASLGDNFFVLKQLS